MKETKTAIFLLLLLLLPSCVHRKTTTVPMPARAAYYWRTTFRLDSMEKAFLKMHHVQKLYIRFFDVMLDSKGLPSPVATLRFDEPVQKGMVIIPVVYVGADCLKQPEVLARNIAMRVKTMCETNGVSARELQIDCDWTRTTEKDYFSFLQLLKKQCEGTTMRTLSATIRLHQLRRPVPPVDYGVLMCYNTGNLRDSHMKNAILDAADVAPWLTSLSSYKLPLCAAYPIFSWRLLFEQGRFRAILRDVNLNDSLHLRQVAPLRYRVNRTFSVPSPEPESFGLMLRMGNEVRVVEVPSGIVCTVARMLERERPDINRQVILYSLNHKDIVNHRSNEVEQMYHLE